MTALQALGGMNLGGGQVRQASRQRTQPQQQAQPQAQPQQPQAQPQQPQASTQPAQPTSGRVGSWVAQLGNQATVRLELRADGSFTWTATRNGKTSTFSGNYNLSGNAMTLTRNDNQSLAGTLTDSNNGFNFKLNGANDSGLTFARA